MTKPCRRSSARSGPTEQSLLEEPLRRVDALVVDVERHDAQLAVGVDVSETGSCSHFPAWWMTNTRLALGRTLVAPWWHDQVHGENVTHS